MRNTFGLEIPQIKDITDNASVNNTISSLLMPVLTYLGVSAEKSNQIISKCLQAASNYTALENYEAEAHSILENAKVAQKIPEKLQARATLVYSQIERYLLPGNVLDYGCGDGQVGELIARSSKQEVVLADVYEHPLVRGSGLRFGLFKQGAAVPFEAEEFDNALALTVFHHSSDPLRSIRDVCRVTKTNGRVIVIESVYGVTGKELPPPLKEKSANYLSLSSEQQRKVNIFFDHFYNRVLHYSKDAASKVNVPFNFNTPSGWEKIFVQCGLRQESVVHLGLDQPTVPEYHTLHVLRKV